MQIGIILLLILGGTGLSLQSAVNARLREAVGAPVLSALISFGVGAAALALLLAFGIYWCARIYFGFAGHRMAWRYRRFPGRSMATSDCKKPGFT